MYPNTALINPFSPPLMTSDGLKALNIYIQAKTKTRIQDSKICLEATSEIREV